MNNTQRKFFRLIKQLVSNLIFLASHPLREMNHAMHFCVRSNLQSYDPWIEKAKNIHKDERCFLLGCGPSLNKIDLSLLRNEIVMGVNGTALIENLKLDYFVTVSHYFWKSHFKALQNLKCKRRFIPYYLETLESKKIPTTWLNAVEQKDHRLLSDKTPYMFSYQPHRFVFLGGTVIFVCLQILFYLGFKEIIILGLDHDYGLPLEFLRSRRYGVSVDSAKLKAHFTKNYYRQGENVHIDIEAMERGYQLAHNAFIQDDRAIYNASPGTKLDIFPLRDYASFF